MQTLKDHRVKVFLIFAVLYWTIAIFAVHYSSTLAVKQDISKHQDTLQKDVAIVRSKIEATIYEDIYIANALSLILEYDPTIIEKRWDTLAEQFIQQASYTRNIGVAPSNIIRYMYPLKGNEAALGLDFRTVPKQYEAVLKAKEIGSVYLDGPLKLVQGGKAIIARYPIFRDSPTNQDYWGTVSIVLNYDEVLEHSKIQDIKYADIALARTNLSNEPLVFYGDSATFENADVLAPIHLPNTEWQLAAKLRHWQIPEVNHTKSMTNLLGLCGAVILFLSIYILFRAYDVAHHASLFDELTNLSNRRHFFEKLSKRIKRAKSEGAFTLLNIDVDDFKTINDRYGHEAGDDVLRYLAKHFKHSVSQHDTVARMGGDEFVVILDQVDNVELTDKVINRIRQVLTDSPFYLGQNKFYISLSIGVAHYQGQSEESLLAEADLTMYQQKLKHKEANVNTGSDFVI